MKKYRVFLSIPVFVAVAALLSLAPALSRPEVPRAKTLPSHRQRFDTTRFMPESELYHGQKGYALTVFHGTKIEKFGVEILGVLSKVNDGKDLILIKVTSGPSVTRQVNIAAGMSGSPVYIGRRMVGAIAYSLPFAREPIGLVTPIGDMLDAWDPDLPAKPSLSMAATTADAIGAPAKTPAISVASEQLARFLGNAAPLPDLGSATTFEPLMTPVMVSGMSAGGVSRLAPILAPYHLVPMAGGGPPANVSAAQREAAQLVPGAAVGVSLVQGDVDMTAIGTLTYRDGDRVIAFGHPFTGIGPIDAALTTADITDLFPSYMDSTKLGAPLTTVGRIFQDRPFSVGGIIGSMPHMVPVTITIHDESDNRTRIFHARVINHPLLTAPLISQVADQAILETHGTPGDAIARVTTDVDAEQLGHIVRKNIFYDPLSIDQSATGDLDSVMRLLSSNPFYPLAIRGVTMSVTIESKHPTAQIDHIFIPKETYAPGDTVEVGVVIKPYRREPELLTIPMVIPSTAPDGSVTIRVRGGASSDEGAISLTGGLIVIRPPTATGPPAATIAQLVRQYLAEPKNNDLIASLQLPSTALDVQGEKLSLLPPAMSAIMRSEHSSGLKMEHDEIKKTVPMGWIISGAQSLTINVAQKDVTDQSSAPAAPSGQSDTTAPPAAASADSALSSDDIATADNDDGDDGDDGSATAPGGSPLLIPQTAQFMPGTKPHNAPPPPPAGAVAPPPASAAGEPQTLDTHTASKPAPVGRLASVWRQNTSAAFSEGTLNNLTISSQDDLRLCPSLSPVAYSTAPYIWSIAPAPNGELYAGTGDDGVVYKATGSTMTPFFHTGELEVNALVFDSDSGNLYAGTSPHGAIYRILPSGKGEKIFTAGEKYVTALALDYKSGTLYAATGGGVGKVYVIPLAAPSTGKVLFSSPEAHLQSLAIGPDGAIYAGGSPDGLIYAIQRDGSAKVLYDAAEPDITALAVDTDGVVYAGTAPSGVIYKITPSASPEGASVKVLTRGLKSPVYGLGLDIDGNLWACASNSVIRIAPDQTLLTYAAATDVSFVSLAVTASGQVYAGTSNMASIYALGAPKSGLQGTYTSPVHDAKLTSRWGTVAWQAFTPTATSVVLQTRSGDVSRPDATWSAWSAPYTLSRGQLIASPPARFIQYRAVISGQTSSSLAAMPRLQSVAIYYLTRNQAPAVKFLSPAGGDAVSGGALLRWAGIDPDKDTLSYSLSYSADAGKSWVPIGHPGAIQAPAAFPAHTGASTASPGETPPTDAEVSSAFDQFKANLDKQTDIPPAVRAQMLQQAPSVIRQTLAEKSSSSASGASAVVDAGHLASTSYKWDTKQVPDGTYQVKVIATDAPSNPTGALTNEAVSAPFIIDNTPPIVAIDAKQTLVDPQSRTVKLHGLATTNTSFVEAVQYHIDDSTDWQAAAADNGLFNSIDEPFTIVTAALSSGVHRITVEAIDQAGNTTTAITQVTVP